MPGLPSTRPAPDLPAGPRAALVITAYAYADPELRQLRAPARDAADLAGILADRNIGGFTVTSVVNQAEPQVRRAIGAFLANRGVGDLVLVYLSCHGLLDRRGRLYFAATDTVKSQLGSTGVESAWLLDQLDECRARRQILILDCCFSGAFARGSKGALDLEHRLAGQGRGRAVLTASRSGEYSFEGAPVAGAAMTGSVFTTALIEGLRTGAADADGDGFVSLDEAYGYAYDHVRAHGNLQTPQRWLYGSEGAIVLSRNPAGITITPARLPQALRTSLDSPYPHVRVGAANTLAEWLTSSDTAQVLAAQQALQNIAETDTPAVAAVARAHLDTGEAGTPAGPGPIAVSASNGPPASRHGTPAPGRPVTRADEPAAPSPDAPEQTVPVQVTAEPRQTGPPAGTKTGVPGESASTPAARVPRRRRRRIALITSAGACIAAATTILAAILPGSPGQGSGIPPAASPVRGGTLGIVAGYGPDNLDTVPAYSPADYMLERAYARQLLSYPTAATTSTSSPAWTTATTPAADAATQVPTTGNGGITNGGKTYTFHIKAGVEWNTSPPRQVTAGDFIREFKAFCNQAPNGFVGHLEYYRSTITGLASYCDAEASYFADTQSHPVTAGDIAGFQDSNTISGLSAPDPLTLQVNLIQPATDFLYLMALPFASARPAEYDRYLPASLQLDQHTISDGPYQVSSYVQGTSITLVPNPAWKQSTDTLRHDYVAKIMVTEGVYSAATQLAEMKAGTQDLPIDIPLDPASIPQLIAGKAPNFRIWPWSNMIPYLVFNLQSPDARGATGKLQVRQAIEYGINKAAIQKLYGGPSLATVISSAIPPGNAGYTTDNPYPTADNKGDTATCRAELKKVGYPAGVTLTYLYENDPLDTQVFNAIQAGLKPCGVTLAGKPETGSSFSADLTNAPKNNQPGRWDIGQALWTLDWFGDTGRSVISPFFQAGCVAGTSNYGCYSSPQMDSLIDQAETAAATSAAAADWRAANELAMQNALIVPLLSTNYPLYASSRVRNNGAGTAIFNPEIRNADITNIWLSNR